MTTCPHAPARRPLLALTALLCLALPSGLVPGLGLGLAAGPALAQDAPAGGATVVTEGEPVLLRAEPSYDAPVLTPLAAGTPVDLLAGPIPGPNGTAWSQVAAVGQTGYVPAAAVAAGTPPDAAVDPPPAPDAPPTAPDPTARDPEPEPEPEPDVSSDPAPPASPAATLPDPAGAAEAGAPATTTDAATLRRGPSAADAPLLVLPPGAPVTVAGPAAAGFLPVTADGAFGWVDAAYLVTGPLPAADPGAISPETEETTPTPDDDPAANAAPAPVGPTAAATTTDAVNLRAGPAQTAPILLVIPAAAPLETVGTSQNGFYPVAYDGQTGWAAAPYLALGDATPPPDATPAPDATPVPDPATPSSTPSATPPPSSSGIAWPIAGGTWTVIQGYNNGTHTNRGPRADYRYSLDLALADGDTAGQPVAAPVAGTVRWVDPGSGGILIDAGNGYGVAMFHLTLDGGLGSGQTVAQGQPLGVVSGPGGPGYAGTPHVDLTLWQLTDGANVSTPFSGPNAIAGQSFLADGSPNQHMSAEITP